MDEVGDTSSFQQVERIIYIHNPSHLSLAVEKAVSQLLGVYVLILTYKREKNVNLNISHYIRFNLDLIIIAQWQ